MGREEVVMNCPDCLRCQSCGAMRWMRRRRGGPKLSSLFGLSALWCYQRGKDGRDEVVMNFPGCLRFQGCGAM